MKEFGMLPPLDRPLVRTPRKIYQNGSIQMKTVFIMHGTYSSLDLNDVHYLKRFHGNHPSGKRNKQMSQKPKIRLQKTPNSSSVIDLDPAIHDHSLTHSHSTTPISLLSLLSLLSPAPTLPHFPPHPIPSVFNNPIQNLHFLPSKPRYSIRLKSSSYAPFPPTSQRRSQKSRTPTMRNCLWSPCRMCGQMTTMQVRGWVVLQPEPRMTWGGSGRRDWGD